jgi:hypothetical protein
MFDKKITVSGVVVKLRPYSEKRLKELVDVNQDIQEFIRANPDKSIGDIREKRGEWFMRKASILWQCDTQVLDIDFFMSEDFEISLLKESEDFFLNSAMYL